MTCLQAVVHVCHFVTPTLHLSQAGGIFNKWCMPYLQAVATLPKLLKIYDSTSLTQDNRTAAA